MPIDDAVTTDKMSVGMARETLAELRKHIIEDEFALYYIWMPKDSVLEALDTALATMPPDEEEEFAAEQRREGE